LPLIPIIFGPLNKLTIKPEAMIACAVFLFGLAFAAYTGHIWEDYWITFRASLNLATGHGLVYTPGERLHTFTSPLGVLLPAGFSWVTGNRSDMLVLWLFRAASCAALAAGLVLLFRSLQVLRLQPVSCWLTVGLVGLDAKIEDFTINGMETGLLIFFAALTLHGLLVGGPRQAFRIGAGWAGLMWSRPDGCVYIGLLALGSIWLLSGRATGTPYQAWLKKLLVAAAVCTVLYLPWFLWAWWYYGSPVPHTIVAKGANHAPLTLSGLAAGLLTFPHDIVYGLSSVQYTFLPAYANLGGWPGWMTVAAGVVGFIAAFVWILPVVRPVTRLFSLLYFGGNYYLSNVLDYSPPWYLPLVALFGYLALGLLFDQLLGLALNATPPDRRARFTGLPQWLRAAAVIVLAGQLAVTVCVARQLQLQQAIIEIGMRQTIGLWLRDHAGSPRDTVTLEPLGYIGYYSGLKMLDYPGLASKEMVAARKRLGRDRENQAYLELKPDWLVLRGWEIEQEKYIDMAGLKKYYGLAKVFDVSDKIKSVGWLPGRQYLTYDQTFLVFRRMPDAYLNQPH